jgi:hypothetical protein
MLHRANWLDMADFVNEDHAERTTVVVSNGYPSAP